MANSVAQLITVLSEKEHLMKELIILLEDERKVVVEMDVAALELADEKKWGLLVQLEDSNNLFRQLLRQMAADNNLPEGANLSSFFPRLTSADRSSLQGLQSRLLRQGENLTRVLLFNRDLLQGSLKMVNGSLQFFQGVFKRSTTYGYGGGMVAAPTDVRLVCKEV